MKVDMRLSIMKPLGAKWITSAYDYLRSESGIVRGGFIEAELLKLWTKMRLKIRQYLVRILSRNSIDGLCLHFHYTNACTCLI